MSQDFDYEDEEKGKKESGGGGGALALLGVLFLPALLVGLAYYLLLRLGRLRFSVIAGVVAVVDVACLLLWALSGSTDAVLYFFQHLGEAASTWQSLIFPLLLAFVVLGGFVGLGIVGWETREIRRNPYRTHLPGTWTYKFQYRRTPRELLRKRKLIEDLKQGRLSDPKKTALGLSEEGRYAPVSRYQTEARTHSLFTGKSGGGKTITMLNLVLADIIFGRPVIMVDFKRDPEIASKLASWTAENGGKFYHFVNGDPEDYDIDHSPGQAFYDPLRAGSPTSKADMVLGMREYATGAEIWKANMQQLLQVTFAMLKVVGSDPARRKLAKAIDWDHGGIYQLASAVAGNNIIELAGACEGSEIQAEAEAVAHAAQGKTGIKNAIEELQGNMRTILASEYGRWMRTEGKHNSIDLYQLTQEPGTVILFSLNSDSEPDFARFIGSMIMSDLTNTSAKRRNNSLKNDVNIYIDEFQVLPPSSVAGLLEKSRASYMAMTLAQQSFDQIVASTPNNGEAYLASILDTCSNFYIHAGSTEDSAERLSKILGKEWVEEYRATSKNKSFFLSLNWSNRRHQNVQTFKEERWKAPPSQFMELSGPTANNGYRSTAVVVNKSCEDPAYRDVAGAVARTVWLIPDKRVLQSYYSGSEEAAAPKRLTLEVTNLREVGEDEEEATPALSRGEHPALPSGRSKRPLLEEDEEEGLPASFFTDEEEDEGGFAWDSVAEEDDELLAQDYSEAEELPPAPPAEDEAVAPPRRSAAFSTSSFTQLREEAAAKKAEEAAKRQEEAAAKRAAAAARREAQAAQAAQAAAAPKAPARPQAAPPKPRGLPLAAVGRSIPVPEDAPEEEGLPPLDF